MRNKCIDLVAGLVVTAGGDGVCGAEWDGRDVAGSNPGPEGFRRRPWR